MIQRFRLPMALLRPALLTLLSALLLLLGACDKSTAPKDGPDTGGPADLPGAVSQPVVAAVGDTFSASNGMEAWIPPNALPHDTTVVLVPVQPPAVGGSFVAAARLEPEGIILSAPMVLRLPLPADWDADDTPLVYEFKGNDPLDAVLTTAYARIAGTAGHYMAEILLSHFSGAVCARNCHAGTMRSVLQAFTGRGCDRDSLLATVQRNYPGVPVPADACGFKGVETIQAFLDSYFDDIGGYDAGQPVPADLMDQMIAAAEAGRQVVVAFKPGQWGARGGPHNFYPTSETEYAHTAVLEMHDGEIQIRNTLATGNERLIEALGGQNVAWWPADRLNEFRDLPQGVAVEMQLCGEPGCLSDPSKNPWGLDLYHPVEGRSYLGRAWDNPWDYFFSEGPWSGVPPRGIPWSAVRVYMEKPGNPAGGHCGDSAEGSLSADVTAGEYWKEFTAWGLIACLGTLNDVGGYPAVLGTTAETIDLQSLFDHEVLTVFMNKTLPGAGTYSCTDDPTVPGWGAVIFYSTPEIRNAQLNDPTLFMSTSGNITLESYSTSVGGRVKGTFSAAISGSQEILVGDHYEDRLITGSAEGSFDAELTDDTFPWGGLVLRSGRIVLQR